MESTITVRQFVARNNVRISCDFADSNPYMTSTTPMRHFKCTLRMGRRQMSLIFSQGMAHTCEPTADDVLICIALDAAGIENTRDFADWASDYGYDTDSRTAERTYKAVVRQTRKLRQFMGDKYDTLIWHTEPN